MGIKVRDLFQINEQRGLSLERIFQISNPFRKMDCEEPSLWCVMEKVLSVELREWDAGVYEKHAETRI